MRRLVRPTAPLVLVGAVVAIWPPLHRAADPTSPHSTPTVVGNLGCAAAACHGGDGRPGSKGSEHATVLEADPHRHAFAVLFQERSAIMVRNLGLSTPAHQTALCLTCHGAAPPNAAPLSPNDSRHRAATCENCHGAAGNYLTTHYQAGWKELSTEAKQAQGLVPTKDLGRRAAMCASCHVGEPGREVDHRLIAAGHPALRFELASHQLEPLYTRHWHAPPNEAGEWLVGQVATARAAAELLRHRAATAAHRDWPELSEYACFACHQRLTGAAGGGGKLPWGTWTFALPLSLSDGPDWAKPPTGDGLTKLAAVFRANDRPAAKDAEAAATAAVAQLDRWLIALRTRPSPTPAELRAGLAHVVRFAGEPTADWDRSTQGFLAAAALYRSSLVADPSSRSPAAESVLADLAARLRFPPGQDGPRTGRDPLARRWAALSQSLTPGANP